MKDGYKKNLQKVEMLLANTCSFDVLLIQNARKTHKIMFSYTDKGGNDKFNKGIIFEKVM
ncbi:hypothetical protein RBH29_10540 [Herbivorax sp. ANBcel31]|uniref:hypothetical protein n=1 Tax=Herbivorax sp. ANBcel31 TaxID=3069754 RepID=UPI0027AE390C|nr:hypothetical protein [Herbivorax sp. ANBcel31]MDQ2086863.1 hypothetical protein [Herbivorax sp. ANBcel31]